LLEHFYNSNYNERSKRICDLQASSEET